MKNPITTIKNPEPTPRKRHEKEFLSFSEDREEVALSRCRRPARRSMSVLRNVLKKETLSTSKEMIEKNR
jgi:hypothetical protein